MQYSVAAVLALAAASVSAGVTNGTVLYTTEVFTAYTTYCPASTQLTFNGATYTVSEATTLTITNCPCTVSKPVTTSSVVAPTSAVIAPPVYTNGTVVATPTKGSVGTTSAASTATATPSTITASGAEKVMALSGASLAGLLGLAAYLL